MIELPHFHDSESSTIAFVLIVVVSVTALALLPRRHRADQLFWIVPCIALSLIEAATDIADLSDQSLDVISSAGGIVVSIVLARRGQSSLGQSAPFYRTALICAAIVLSWPLAGVAGAPSSVLEPLGIATLIVASCWPMVTLRVFEYMRVHGERVLLFLLILIYAILILTRIFDQFDERTAISQLEAAAHFLGVLIGFVASGLALRQVLRENEQLAVAERTARLTQEESSRFLRALIDTAPAAVYVKDLEGRYRLVNKVAAAWANLPESDILGHVDAELFPDAVAKVMRDHDLAVIETRGQQTREISLRIGGQGSERHAISHKSPLLDAAGNVTAIVGLAIDITQMREVERELTDAKFKAEEASRSKSNFLAHMSHELRTPLNAIIGFSDVIQRGMFGPDKLELYQQYAGDIHRAGNLLLAQVNDLLDVSRIEAGTFEVALQPVALGTVAEDCRRLLRDQADRKGVILTIDAARPLPKVTCDRRATLQVLINLVGNAIKYVPQGCRITIAGGRTESGIDYFMVEDNGPGLPTKVLKALLDPWTHQSAVVAEDGRGGMGLMLSRKLMEVQGGRLVVESTPGKGTRIACQFAHPQPASAISSRSSGA